MNFSSSIMNSMGISLGGIEIATDFLYGNSDLYEPDLTEIKTTISKKPITPKPSKPVRPKISRQSVINKFSLVPRKAVAIVPDEALDDDTGLIQSSSDFDFSFDDNVEIIKQSDLLKTYDKSADTQPVAQSGQQEKAQEPELLKQFNQMLASGNVFSRAPVDTEAENEVSNDTDLSQADNEEDELESLLEADEDEEQDLESILEADEDEEPDLESILEEDEQGSEDDSSETDSTDDELENLFDDSDIEEETDKTEDDLDAELEGLLDADEDDTDSNDEQDLDSELESLFDDEDEGDEPEIPAVEARQTTKAPVQTPVAVDISKPEIEQRAVTLEKKETEQVTNTQQVSAKASDIQMEAMQKQIAELQAQIQRMQGSKASVEASNGRKEKFKNNEVARASVKANIQKTDIDSTMDETAKIIKSAVGHADIARKPEEKKELTEQDRKQQIYEHYDSLRVDVLYGEVKKYMIEQGVNKALVPYDNLVDKFGIKSIRKLIEKSYIVRFGKGVTMGRS